MKIAFFGTPEFAWEILSGILKFPEVEVSLVVSQPDMPVGRKQILEATAVKKVALHAWIHVLQPEKIKKNNEFHTYLRELHLDFIVVVAYGKIIPTSILDIPKYGCINIHGSILPKYRGASPVQAAIKSGERETWLTIMFMSQGMDEWDMLSVGKVNVDNVDTSVEIFRKFVKIGPDLLVSTLHWVISGNIKWIPQDDTKATYCSKISREDGQIFFQKQSAQDIYNTYRSYTPWPWIYSFYEGKRFVIEEIEPHPNPLLEEREKATIQMQPLSPWGERIQEWGFTSWSLIKIEKNRYGIVCADKKVLEVKQVKLEGKKSMDMASFANGNRGVVAYTFQ
jgi:methionyl-tRNA formyltransferase